MFEDVAIRGNVTDSAHIPSTLLFVTVIPLSFSLLSTTIRFLSSLSSPHLPCTYKFLFLSAIPPSFYLTRSLSSLSSLPFFLQSIFFSLSLSLLLSLCLSVRLCLVSSWRGASQRSCGQGVGGSDSIIRY